MLTLGLGASFGAAASLGASSFGACVTAGGSARTTCLLPLPLLRTQLLLLLQLLLGDSLMEEDTMGRTVAGEGQCTVGMAWEVWWLLHVGLATFPACRDMCRCIGVVLMWPWDLTA